MADGVGLSTMSRSQGSMSRDGPRKLSWSEDHCMSRQTTPEHTEVVAGTSAASSTTTSPRQSCLKKRPSGGGVNGATGSFTSAMSTFDGLVQQLSSLRQQLVEQHQLEVTTLAQENTQLRDALGFGTQTQIPTRLSQTSEDLRRVVVEDGGHVVTYPSADDDSPDEGIDAQSTCSSDNLRTGSSGDLSYREADTGAKEKTLDQPYWSYGSVGIRPSLKVVPERDMMNCLTDESTTELPNHPYAPDHDHENVSELEDAHRSDYDSGSILSDPFASEGDEHVMQSHGDDAAENQGNDAIHPTLESTDSRVSLDPPSQCGSGHSELEIMKVCRALSHSSLTEAVQEASANLNRRYFLRSNWAELAHLATVPFTDILPSRAFESHQSLSMQFGMFRPMVSTPTIDANSTVRHAWVSVALLFLLYDCIMVPVSIGFDLKGGVITDVVNMLACFFWTFDIVLNFFLSVPIDGKKVIFKEILKQYARSWLALDAFLTSMDWLKWIWRRLDVESPFNSGWSRGVSMLRFLRIVRLVKSTPFLQEFLLRTTAGLNVRALTVLVTFLLVLGAHFSACFWHLIGNELDNGWVHANDLESMSIMGRYMLSMRWAVGRLQGASSTIQLNTTLEGFVEIAHLLACLTLVSTYMGIIMHTIIVRSTSHANKLKIAAVEYSEQHGISKVAHHKLLRHVVRQKTVCPREQLAADERFLRVLPSALQEEMQYEVRLPMVSNCEFLVAVDEIVPRAIRRLCHEAMVVAMAVEAEVLFSASDQCELMFFIGSGSVKYTSEDNPGGDPCPQTFRTSCDVQYPSDPTSLILKAGTTLSEAALWTFWLHRGDCIAEEETMCLTINANKFGEVFAQYWPACVAAVKHARYCIHVLRKASSDDTTKFECSLDGIDELDQEELKVLDTSDHHVLFISHYKQEAGTEAALMRYALKELISVDLECPVFVDSEDLADLTFLKLHIEESDALVVLLTPGILTRPWCLLEIVTAYKHDVQIIPVEIQRPGMTYEYPDEYFYQRLRTGTLLDKAADKLLKQHNVRSLDLEAAVRKMFQKIALPYSPHKSDRVRGAELLDIMKRVPSKCWQGVEYLVRAQTLTNIELHRTQPRRMSIFSSHAAAATATAAAAATAAANL